MKITVDGSADHGWTVEIFERVNDSAAVWSGHPDVEKEADAVRAALAEWERPTQHPDDRMAAEAARLREKALEYDERQVEAAEAVTVAAQAEAELVTRESERGSQKAQPCGSREA